MAEKINMTHDETLAVILEKSKTNDSFLVKVYRKRQPGGIPEAVCTFADAQAIHLVNPETWLPRIAGGGPLFLLQVFHADNPAVAIGGYLQLHVPLESYSAKITSEIDTRVVKSAQWTGPLTLKWPTEDKSHSDGPRYSLGSASLPPTASPGDSAANVRVPGEARSGAFLFQEKQLAAQQEMISLERERIQRQRDEFLEEQRRQREDLAEQRRKSELESIKRDSDARIREMEARLVAASTASSNKPDIATTIATLITAAAPLLQKVAENQNEMRLAMLKQQEQIAAQTAESNRMLMTAMLQKPSVDPTIERLFSELKNSVEKNNAQAMPQSTMLHSMAETTAQMTHTMMELVQSAADMNLGGGRDPNDHPALKAVREGVKAVQSLFAGYAQAAAARNQQPVHPQQFVAPPQVPHQFAQVPQQFAQAPQQAHSQQTQQAPAAPQQVQLPQPKDVLDLLENMVKMQAPVEEVVGVFIQAFKNKDEALFKALDEAGGEVEAMIINRLGGFLAANPHYVPYMQSLEKEIEKQGSAAGIFEPDTDAPQEEEAAEFSQEDA